MVDYAYIVGMSNVVELQKDNLYDYFSEKKLIVVFSTLTCSACIKIKPHLYNLPDEYKVVIVDVHKHLASTKFFPGGVKYYPSIAIYNNGYFTEELTQHQIINNQIQ